MPAPRDFTLYKYKYFPLTSFTKSGLFNAVCVKKCPALGGTKKTKGNCVKKVVDKDGKADPLQDGKPGVLTTDYTLILDADNKPIATQELCGDMCISSDTCNGF